MSVNTIAHLVFLSQVLGGGAAEEGAWPESPTVCGHLQVSLVESITAGTTDVPGGNSLAVCAQYGYRVCLNRLRGYDKLR